VNEGKDQKSSYLNRNQTSAFVEAQKTFSGYVEGCY